MNIDYILRDSKVTQEELFFLITNTDTRYIVVKTKYTTHHLEKLLGSGNDRGTLKWMAETSINDYEKGLENKDKEVYSSHIDGADLFPRLYFLTTNFCSEFQCWLSTRNLSIIEIKVPIEYSPMFDAETHENFYKKILLRDNKKDD